MAAWHGTAWHVHVDGGWHGLAEELKVYIHTVHTGTDSGRGQRSGRLGWVLVHPCLHRVH
jgi:hypothetical protein